MTVSSVAGTVTCKLFFRARVFVCTCGENSTLRTECVVNSRADYIKIAYNEGGVYYTRIDMVMKKYVGFRTQFLGKFILKHL